MERVNIGLDSYRTSTLSARSLLRFSRPSVQIHLYITAHHTSSTPSQ